VFEGGFTLEAAEAVIDLTAFDDAPWTVDAVHALVDKSFVRPRGDGRFDLLVSVQVYAAEHLETEGRYAGSGPRAMAAAQMRAIAWFAALGPIRAIEGRCADLDNLVTAPPCGGPWRWRLGCRRTRRCVGCAGGARAFRDRRRTRRIGVWHVGFE
jgi:hypothetical protein